jgi:hypothetical protein
MCDVVPLSPEEDDVTQFYVRAAEMRELRLQLFPDARANDLVTRFDAAMTELAALGG